MRASEAAVAVPSLSVIPHELIVRIFSLVPVVDMPKTTVNRHFRDVFRDAQLWKARVHALLRVCTPEGVNFITRHMRTASHLWNKQLKYDIHWQRRVLELMELSADRPALQMYLEPPDHQAVYRKTLALQMVCVRGTPAVRLPLATIPFIQRIRYANTRQEFDAFSVSMLADEKFVAYCTWEASQYHFVLNGTPPPSPPFLLRVGDTLEMIKHKSGKVRQFEMKLTSFDLEDATGSWRRYGLTSPQLFV